MKKNCVAEYLLLFSTGFLLIIGVVIIASVSAVPSQNFFGTPYYYLVRQLVYILVGLSLGYLAYRINLNFIKKYALLPLLANFLLFISVMLFGFSAGGATRWFSLGPVMIQPAEFIKLTFLIYLCLCLSRIAESGKRRLKNKNKNILKGHLSCLFFFILSGFFLYSQPDGSNLVILFAISAVVYFVSETPLWHSALALFSGVGGIFALVKLAPYRLGRVEVFLNPEIDPMGAGYQIKQIMIAIGSGGIFGLGLGMSRQKLGFLPEAMGDAIFAVFSEEAGFLGSALVVLLFMTFLWSGLTIAKKSTDKFSSLLAVGITSWIIIQAFVNIGAMLNVLPLVGVALPFLSYGGSHLVAEFIAVGLLLNIAKNKT